ncbi:ArdC-like ssDNA-binding domain-containing protein [Nocardia rhizosphaerihabitans]|uniref:ArdC-like ssDNA-binding domain-containing protein n=1 Tax=Nocardia rhizosphaerihabitans TaxID=1691570 RepID=UPI00366B372E
MTEHAPLPKGIDANKLDWPNLMQEALTMPGGLGNTYNRFYQYSFNNQILLFLQGVTEPVATYDRWKEMGRQVKKGSQAKSILRPIIRNELDDEGKEYKRLTGFKFVRCLFTASETVGDELEPYEPPEWSKERALGNLAIREVPFVGLNGNVQGYSKDREVAISPVAKDPFPTLLHEIGHIALGHTSKEGMAEYSTHNRRGLMEFQAESVSYLAGHELGAYSESVAAESRDYIQSWLKDAKPSDTDIRQVFGATDRILKAGRLEAAA